MQVVLHECVEHSGAVAGRAGTRIVRPVGEHQREPGGGVQRVQHIGRARQVGLPVGPALVDPRAQLVGGGLGELLVHVAHHVHRRAHRGERPPTGSRSRSTRTRSPAAARCGAASRSPPASVRATSPAAGPRASAASSRQVPGGGLSSRYARAPTRTRVRARPCRSRDTCRARSTRRPRRSSAWRRWRGCRAARRSASRAR